MRENFELLPFSKIWSIVDSLACGHTCKNAEKEGKEQKDKSEGRLEPSCAMFEWHAVAETFRVPKICHEQRRTVQKFSHKSSDASREYKLTAAGSDLKGDQSAILRNSHGDGGKSSRDGIPVLAWEYVPIYLSVVHGSNYYTGICTRHAEIVGSYRRNRVFAPGNRSSGTTKEKNKAKSNKNGTIRKKEEQ